ncbi:hypothetical protein ABTI49_12290 [Acinetobacter baumannii]|uniref:hypothetical protein n=1 Tax=Acinetobacter baumannii TaxID=470 RepID=UPI000DE6A36A|nr:hypothetical protein [Acinetobacter baumannii]MDA3577338.1 hypothetical protein [Acinetobacter baumannii]MDN8240451.1 hypothetical protein [Acinetobacter baumannii]SSR66546.1 Uncharacterised protein [Acinetobacter baumannii]
MTDLNKEREVNLRFEQDDGFVWVFDGDSQFGTEISHLMMMHADEYNEDELRVICNHAACEIGRLRAELEKAKAQEVPEHIITLQRNGEVFKFDLLDLLRRSLKSSKVLKTRENWSHVSKMVGLGSTTATLLCKEMNVDPDGTVFVASESGAEG